LADENVFCNWLSYSNQQGDAKKILLWGVEGRMLNGCFAESAALALLHL